MDHWKCVAVYMVFEWWMGAQKWFQAKSTIAMVFALCMIAVSFIQLPRRKDGCN